jgi:hypothetical protein
MGTQGIVRVFDGEDEILCFSRHSDGCPEGLGVEVRDFVVGKCIVNGISSRHDESKIANGAGCLAAQLVAHFKDGVGGVYIQKPGGPACPFGYEYHVKAPGFAAVNVAKDAAGWNAFNGLPIVFEAYDCSREGKKLIDVGKCEEDEEVLPPIGTEPKP